MDNIGIMSKLKCLTIIFLLFFEKSSCFLTNSRIFDGLTANVDEFPWMVVLRFSQTSNVSNSLALCGGSIISDRFVITTASCFYNGQQFPQAFFIQAGIHNILYPNVTTQQIRSISNIYVHPDYNATNFINDIALIRVSNQFDLTSPVVSSINISGQANLADLDLTTIGWGLINESDSTIAATFLQKVTIREDVQCTQTNTLNVTTQLCATGKINMFHIHHLFWNLSLGTCLRKSFKSYFSQ